MKKVNRKSFFVLIKINIKIKNFNEFEMFIYVAYMTCVVFHRLAIMKAGIFEYDSNNFLKTGLKISLSLKKYSQYIYILFL